MGLFFSDCMIKVNFVLMKKAMQLCMMYICMAWCVIIRRGPTHS